MCVTGFAVPSKELVVYADLESEAQQVQAPERQGLRVLQAPCRLRTHSAGAACRRVGCRDKASTLLARRGVSGACTDIKAIAVHSPRGLPLKPGLKLLPLWPPGLKPPFFGKRGAAPSSSPLSSLLGS